MLGRSSPPLCWDDTDQLQCINLGTTTRARRRTHSRRTSGDPNLTPYSVIWNTTSFFDRMLTRRLSKGRSWHTSVSTTAPSKHRHHVTRCLLAGTLAIDAVTAITCHQSRITGESTCLLKGVHSKRESIDPQHVVNNVHVLRTCISQLTSLEESDFEVSANPQDMARDARSPPRADSRTIDQRATQDTKSSARKQDAGLLTCLLFYNASPLRPFCVARQMVAARPLATGGCSPGCLRLPVKQ